MSVVVSENVKQTMGEDSSTQEVHSPMALLLRCCVGLEMATTSPLQCGQSVQTADAIPRRQQKYSNNNGRPVSSIHPWNLWNEAEWQWSSQRGSQLASLCPGLCMTVAAAAAAASKHHMRCLWWAVRNKRTNCTPAGRSLLRVRLWSCLWCYACVLGNYDPS